MDTTRKAAAGVCRWAAGIAALAFLTLLPAGCSSGPSEIAPPEQVRAEADGLHTLKAEWDEVEEATEYVVTLREAGAEGSPEEAVEESAEQSADGSSESEEPSDFSAKEADPEAVVQTVEQTEAVFEGLKADTIYEISVKSVYRDENRELFSETAAMVSVRTETPKIGEAAGLAAAMVSDSELAVTWEAYEPELLNADGSAPQVLYILYGAETEDGEYAVLAEKTAETSYAHTRLPEQTTRYYKILAVVTVDGKEFTGPQTAAVSATTDQTPEPVQAAPEPAAPAKPSGGQTGGSTSSGTSVRSEQDRQAREVAQQIAASIGPGTDLERVSQAAQIVSGYYRKGVHKESGDNYYRPYGVFIAGESSCAGCTRALGLVLECMGYKWEHVNENQWAHQWCKVEMDGQMGYADGQVGWAGYGEHPVAGGQ
ncbi:MAG: hypothetical protein ACOX6U_03200 [Oscillospiraceae bacterium]|jgi:hypothetical protein